MADANQLAPLLTAEGWALLLQAYGPTLLRALLLIVGTWIGVKVATSSFRVAARRVDVEAQIVIRRIIQIVIIGIGAATLLDTIGVPLTTFVTVLGVVGVGISLAMQDILKSFVAGTYLLFERPFRIGDEISVKDQRGVVEHVGIRTTRLRNEMNVQIIIPNAVVFAEMVANRTNEKKPEPTPEPEEPPLETVESVPSSPIDAAATTSGAGGPASPGPAIPPILPPARPS